MAGKLSAVGVVVATAISSLLVLLILLSGWQGRLTDLYFLKVSDSFKLVDTTRKGKKDGEADQREY